MKVALPIPKATGSSSTNCGFDLLGCVKLSSQMVVETFAMTLRGQPSRRQNGRAERHGGWIKHKIEEELQSKQSVVTTEQDLDLLVLSLVANKNRYFHTRDYSPYQLTFGLNPRLPQELLTGDPLQEPGRSDINADSFEQDSAAAEFNRAFRIRDKARQLCMTSNAKEKIRLSSQGQLHQQRQWHVGLEKVLNIRTRPCNQMSVDRTRIGGASICRPYGVGVYEGSAAEVQQRSSVTWWGKRSGGIEDQWSSCWRSGCGLGGVTSN